MKSILIKLLCLAIISIPNSALAEHKMDGDMVYSNGKPFAQVKFLRIKKLDTDGTYTGIAVYYFDTKEQMWVCPQDGWRLKDAKTGFIHTDIDKIGTIYNSDENNYYLLRSHDRLSKYEFITGGCFDFKISNDSNISVVQSGMFWNSTIQFDIVNKKFH